MSPLPHRGRVEKAPRGRLRTAAFHARNVAVELDRTLRQVSRNPGVRQEVVDLRDLAQQLHERALALSENV